MAQNTESSRTGIRPYRSPYGHFPIGVYQETTNSTFIAGHLVQLNTATNAHRLVSASSNSTRYLGVVAEAGSSDAAVGEMSGQKRKPVYLARPEVEFMGWIKEVIQSTLIGQYRGFQRDTTRAIDVIGGSTTPSGRRALITEVGSDSNISAGNLASIGDTNGYVAFRFTPEHTEFAKPTVQAYSIGWTDPDISSGPSHAETTVTVAGATTNAGYLLTPFAQMSTGYFIAGVRCSTVDEVTILFGSVSASSLSGSTGSGTLLQFSANV